MNEQLTSPFSSLFIQLIDRLNDKAKSLRFITQDIGQLENYEMRPAVSWPCCLIDIDNFNFSDAQSKHHQIGQGTVTVRLGLVKYTDLSNLTPDQAKAKAVEYLEVEQEVYTALHAWAPNGFSRCIRQVAVTERRDDDIRVRVMKFSIAFTDESAQPKKQTVPRPEVVIS